MPCYDQSCTSADLVNIPSLVLSDTFNTWFDRTNQLIEVANAINIFDIGVGPTDGGLRLERGCSGSWYSGVAVLYVNPGAGIGVGTESFTNNYNKVIVDVARLQDLGGNTATNPNIDDYFIISDKSDTRQGPDGTPKRVLAKRMLPNQIEFGLSGDGTLTIQGNLNVVGNFVVSGTESFVDSNDLRIEDKIIELAYGRYVELNVVSDGATLTSGTFSSGMTAYYSDNLVPDENNATTIGTIFSWSVSDPGITGVVRISSFSQGGVSDFESAPGGEPLDGGKLVVTGGGYLGVLDVTGPIGIGDYFLPDDILQPAGIVIKGSESDKTFLWVCNAPEGAENWNAFVANKNLGVSGPGNWILSSKFASYGYSDPTVDNSFTYLGQGDSFTKYSVGSTLVMGHSPNGGETGTTFGIVHMGSTGPNILPGVPVYDWVEYFNADQLDGAHATTSGDPWTIPILGGDGRLGGNLVAADSIRKTFNAGTHPFSVGDVLRVNVDGSLTFASANTIPTAEALGMVASVSGSNVTLVTKGFISGLTGARIGANLPLVTGNVYFLSPTQAGGLIDDPDSGVGIEPGEVRKAMLLAMGSDSGYVLNYTGVVNGDSSDVVHMASFTPIGAVQPYAGPVSNIPRNWMLCNGRRMSVNEYSELYSAIGNSYSAISTKVGSESVTIEGDTRGLQVNDSVTLSWNTGTQILQVGAVVTEVNTVTRVVTVNVDDTSDGIAFINLAQGSIVTLYGRVSSTNTSIFFLPDMRRRTAFGSSSGTGIEGSGNLTPSLELGDAGGSNTVTLNQEVSVGFGAWGNSSSSVDSLPPYVVFNWIIRTKKGADATILEGHNHDLYYIRYNSPHTIAAGAANNLTLSDRQQFRSNARVLSNGADGADTFGNSLAVNGLLNANQGVQTLGLAVTGSAVFGGALNSPGAKLYTFYGATGSIFRLYPPTRDAMMNGVANFPQYMQISGLSGAVDVPRNPPPFNPSDMPTVPVRYHTYEMFDPSHTAGEYAPSAKAVHLTIQTDTGQVTCQPMYRVINRMPTAQERMRLPQGFLWVHSSETPPSFGDDTRGAYIKSGSQIHRLTPPAVVPPAPLPFGAIIMWFGSIASIPSGWALCDGSQNTPDLRNRFIVGASIDSSGPTIAAETTITGTRTKIGGNISQPIPEHRHGFGTGYGADDITVLQGNWSTTQSYPSRGVPDVNGNADTGGNINSGNLATAVNNTSEGGQVSVIPPYFALAYIMKISST